MQSSCSRSAPYVKYFPWGVHQDRGLRPTHDSAQIHLVGSVVKHPKGFVWFQNGRGEGDLSFRSQGAHLVTRICRRSHREKCLSPSGNQQEC